MRAKSRCEPGPRRRVSHDLEQCGGGYLLSLEDDAPIEGERAVFLVNITDPCWIWRGADLTKVKSIRAVGRARSLQLPDRQGRGEDSAAQARDPRGRARDPARRLQGRAGWHRLARAGGRQPGAHAAAADRLIDKTQGKHDLCFTFTRAKVDPIWAIGSIELVGTELSDHPCAIRRLVRAARWSPGRGFCARPCSAMAWPSIPPSNELRAPCDGEIISVAAARHALALRSSAGAEILLHVGIDTVALGGEGFQRARAQRRSRACRRSAADLRSRPRGATAPSLMTPVIITNGERFRIRSASLDRSLEARRRAVRARGVERGRRRAMPRPARRWSANRVVVAHAHGIHARPAALIARIAKNLPYEIEIRARGRAARARSAVALMSLGIRGGDEVVIAGFEARAATGVAAIAEAIRNLEAVAAPAPAPASQLRLRLDRTRAA